MSLARSQALTRPAALPAEPRPAERLAPPPRPAPGGIELAEFLRLLRRRRRLLLLVLLGGGLLAALLAGSLTPRYVAEAQLAIEAGPRRILDMEAVAEGVAPEASAIETQIRLLRSRDHALRVIDGLGLWDDPELVPGEGPRGGLAGALAHARRLLAPAPAAVPDATAAAEARLEAVARAFQARLEISHDGRSRVVGVAYRSTSPAQAARVANAAAALYVQAQLEEKRAETRGAAQWLGRRLEELRLQLREAEQAIEAYRSANDLVDARGLTLGEQQLAELGQRLVLARAERAEREARLARARALAAQGGAEALSEVMASPVIQGLRGQEAMLVREEAQLAQEYGPRHPRIVQLRAEQADLRARIAAEVEAVLRNLEHEVGLARARERALEASLEGARAGSAEARQAEVRLRELERDAEAVRALYRSFLARFREASEQQEIVQADARVVARASVPTAPAFPQPRLVLASGLTATLILALLLALLRDRLDSGLRSAREVEARLGLPCLGLVPETSGGTLVGRRRALHRYLLDRPLSTYAEAIRSVQAGLILGGGAVPKVVQVTSALPGEGKTTLALSLAAAAARAGRRTVLVDLDLRHPSSHHALDGRVEAGLVEFLDGQRPLDQILRIEPREPNLHLIPVRAMAPDPTDILTSRRLRTLLAALEAAYDLVVLDTTPLLGLTDARIAATLADRVVFALQWERTPAEVAENALQALRELGAGVAGCVLTRVDFRRHAAYRYGDIAQFRRRYRRYYVD